MLEKFKYRYRKFKFTHSKHFARMMKFYGGIVKTGDLVFDIGSNNGERAIVFEKLNTKVICVEPQQSCVRLLKQYFGENKEVIIIDKACGAEEGTGEIAICDQANTISSMSEKWKTSGRFSKDFQWNTKQKIDITTLDKIIEKYGTPVLCKIDVEGFETEVLKGLHKKVGCLSFEFTEEFFDDAEICMDLLDALGNAKYNFSLGDNMFYEGKDYTTRGEMTNALKSKFNVDLWGDIYVKFKD